jgi:ABC-2 type transport system permease protein
MAWLLVARAEWQALLRLVILRWALAVVLGLGLLTAAACLEHMRAVEHERSQLQAHADQHWQAQPDRHPHRAAHYGHYVFRSPGPLASFDPGVDALTGHLLFLEAHRQNAANFSEARQSSALLRLGMLTPAFVLQVVVPLLIVFLAFGSVAFEREGGQLRLLLVHGLGARQIVLGKLAAHGAAALALAAPALLFLAWLAITQPEGRARGLALLAAYLAYLLAWSSAAVLVSAWMKRARHALFVLVGAWLMLAVVLPRLAAGAAAVAAPLDTQVETDLAVHASLARIGDSHDPNDPYFSAFKKRTLARYGVTRVEDLPVNYGGLVMAEGERLTSELFRSYMSRHERQRQSQRTWLARAGWFTPLMPLRDLSASLAGSDGAHHADFLLAAEHYRFDLVQRLNQLHTEKIHYQNDRDQRVSHEDLADVPRFQYQPAGTGQLLVQGASRLATLAGWLVLLVILALGLAPRLLKVGERHE